MNLLAIIRDRISEKPINPIVHDVNDTGKSHDAFENKDLIPLNEKASLAADDQALVDWFLQQVPPPKPFNLDDARRVSDPVKFFSAIRQEVESRATSPRWRCGATLADLRCLKAVAKPDTATHALLKDTPLILNCSDTDVIGGTGDIMMGINLFYDELKQQT